MADEATFKNPGVQTLEDYWSVGDNKPNFECHTFDKDEFDMEVTFTRKPPKIRVGDTVQHLDYSFEWKVLAVYQDQAWVVHANPRFGVTPKTCQLRDLTPA